VTWPLGSIDPRLYKLTSDNDDDDYDPPDNHIGRVWFGVKYEAQSEKLLVALVKAKNLVSRVNLLVSRVYLLVSRVYPPPGQPSQPRRGTVDINVVVVHCRRRLLYQVKWRTLWRI